MLNLHQPMHMYQSGSNSVSYTLCSDYPPSPPFFLKLYTLNIKIQQALRNQYSLFNSSIKESSQIQQWARKKNSEVLDWRLGLDYALYPCTVI